MVKKTHEFVLKMKTNLKQSLRKYIITHVQKNNFSHIIEWPISILKTLYCCHTCYNFPCHATNTEHSDKHHLS